MAYKKNSTPPWSWLGWVRLPLSRATGGRRRPLCAPGSRLPPLPAASLSSPTAIDGKRRSPPTQIFPPSHAPLSSPNGKPAGPSIAPPIAPRPAGLRASSPGTRRTSPIPNPSDSLVSPRPVQCSLRRLDRPTQPSPCPARSGSPARFRPDSRDSGRPDGT